MPPLSPPDYRIEAQTYTRRNIADLLSVSDRHVDRLTSAGLIPGAFRVGRLVRYRRAVVDAWLAGKAEAAN